MGRDDEAGFGTDGTDGTDGADRVPNVAHWATGRQGWAAGGAGPGTRDLSAHGRDLRPDLRAFVATARDHGLRVPTDRAIMFLEAAAALAPVDLVDLYWAGRTTLVDGPGARPAYDRAFRAHFVTTPSGSPDDADAMEEPQTVWVDRPDGGEHDEGGHDDEPRPGAVASAHEALRHRRFDRATDEELVAMRQLMARIDLVVPPQRHRRTRAARRGRRLDVGRSLRHAMRTDGEVVHRVWRRRRERQRPLVILLDVSGSMADFSRALLQFAHVARVHAGRVEVFVFGTRLTRLTRVLDARTVDDALAGAAEAVQDWDSGTRIGESLDRLHRRWGRRGMLRGALVLLVSDGLERGDIDLLSRSMERLHRQAHAVVWINPLKADPRYEPLARGMAAALPYVDRFLTGHDVASLETLAEVIADV